MSDIFNNELFEAFASASDNVFIYVCDMKTNISRWSKASVEYFGLSGEYLEDAATIWEQHIHPDDRALYNEDISGVFSGTKRVFDTCQKYKTLQTAEMRAFLCQILFIFMLYGVVLYAIIRYEALVR